MDSASKRKLVIVPVDHLTTIAKYTMGMNRNTTFIAIYVLLIFFPFCQRYVT